MYSRRYGLIRTLAPLHVGAAAGEESGNLNLIFRDAFTRTGIIPGSSIRGRFRAESRQRDTPSLTNQWFGAVVEDREVLQSKGRTQEYSEAFVKFEYASLVWLPVFCPGQPVVWVSCPRLLDRYRRVVNDSTLKLPKSYTASPGLHCREGKQASRGKHCLFFNLGYVTVEKFDPSLQDWIPKGAEDTVRNDQLLVVDDNDIGAIHDMSLYRQSRVRLEDNQKKVMNFFNVEALPEDSLLVFPIGIRSQAKDSTAPPWQPFGSRSSAELYFGGLESIGFGRCDVTLCDLEESR
jgi:CRISPR-associated protein Cmr4